MNPNPSLTFDDIEKHLAMMNATTLEALKADGLDGQARRAIEISTACYYEYVRSLLPPRDEEPARPVLPQSTGAGIWAKFERTFQQLRREGVESKPVADPWPTVDTVDLHLPVHPAPDCKVVARMNGLIVIRHQTDGYYFKDRRTGVEKAVIGEHNTKYCKEALESAPGKPGEAA